tara:strand:+ start:1979 stop:2245 length:267 start_codon:yes stop_codon:yes gene_type:complete
MPFVVRATDLASCLHPITGSATVFAGGLGVSRVSVDTAGGGLDLGPGFPTVMCEGSPVSVMGDAIVSHGDNAHAAAMMVGASSDVLAG